MPGIGPSTAGAICAIAFGQRAAILDGNVKRVLIRFHAIQEWPGAVIPKLWELSDTYTPKKRVADYTQAMMDLGATVCKRGQPLCGQCPLQENCRAYALQLQATLPRAKKSKKLPIRNIFLLVIRNDKHFFLEKRPPLGVWASLWSLPEVRALEDVEIFCKKLFGRKSSEFQTLPAFRHTFSHFHLDITPVEILIKPNKTKLMEAPAQIWYNVEQPATIGLPAPIKSLLEKLNDSPN